MVGSDRNDNFTEYLGLQFLCRWIWSRMTAKKTLRRHANGSFKPDQLPGIYAPVNSKTAHPPPRANPGHLTRVKLCTVGNLTQNEARPVGHLTFVSKRLSAVGNKRISQFFDSACAPRSRVIALVDSTWVFLLLSFYICISWNMPLFKVWSDDKLKKKFVVAENFAELVSKGKRFCLYSFFMSAWRDRMLHATSDLADQYS